MNPRITWPALWFLKNGTTAHRTDQRSTAGAARAAFANWEAEVAELGRDTTLINGGAPVWSARNYATGMGRPLAGPLSGLSCASP